MQRALRERREGADALDLVAEELDAERLAPGRRIDVDDAAAERELAALLRLLDALVAREREVLGERVDPLLVARSNADRLGARLGRRHALGERGCRGADEPAGGEDVEGARPLADEVRRRLQARSPSSRRGSGRSATRSSPRNQAAASAMSRASASSGASTTSGRPSSS